LFASKRCRCRYHLQRSDLTNVREKAMKTSVLVCLLLICSANVSLTAQDQAQVATWKYPISVAASTDAIYVADRQLPGIWVVKDGKAKVYFKADKKIGSALNAVRCLAMDQSGHLVAGDSATRDVYRFDDQRVPLALTGGKIGIPMGIAVAKDGTLFVSDLELKQIVRIPVDSRNVEVVAAVEAPTGLALAANGDILVICRAKDPVRRVTAAGEVSVVVAGTPFGFPQDIAVDGEGKIFVTDGYAKAIFSATAGEAPTKLFAGDPLVHPVGICRSGDVMLVVDPRAKKLFRLVDDGLESVLSE
jgi:sugar lactone lactonase YvrE